MLPLFSYAYHIIMNSISGCQLYVVHVISSILLVHSVQHVRVQEQMWLRVAACVLHNDLPQLIYLACVPHLSHLCHND
jgi:hypothetical protein